LHGYEDVEVDVREAITFLISESERVEERSLLLHLQPINR
jgi:hypothetical protein